MGILAIGAGAGEGLQDYLTRLLRERQQAEIERHNQAQEAQSSRALDMNAMLRSDAQKEREQARIEKNIGLRGIGDYVTEPEHAEEVGAGAPAGAYDITPDPILKLSGFTSLPEGQRPDVQPNGRETIQAPRLITFKGTGQQRRQAEQDRIAQERADKMGQSSSAVSLRPETVTYKGKPVDAIFNPRTGTYTLPGGQDITKDVQHYEKPPQQLFTPVQSGENFIKFDRRTGKFTDSTGQEVQNPALATPNAVRQRMNMADRVKSHVQETMDLIEEADKKGLLGPLMGRWNDLVSNRIGSSGNPETDELTGQLAFNLSGLRTGFANVHGGARGGGSIQMAQLWKDIYDSKQMSKERLLGALKAEQKWLDTYGSGGGSSSGGNKRVRYDMNGNPIKE